MGRLDLDFATTMRFGDGEALKSFSLSHRLGHAQISDSIASKFNVAVTSFDVGDERARAAWELVMIDPDNAPAQAREALQAWLLLHAEMHQSEYDAIGLGVAYDLSTVDFSNQEQFYTWMLQHQQVHALEADALGIT